MINCFRPDLVEWKRVEKMRVRERIDLAFHVMDREYGVTRLLDPEGETFVYIFPSLEETWQKLCVTKNTRVCGQSMQISRQHFFCTQVSSTMFAQGVAQV